MIIQLFPMPHNANRESKLHLLCKQSAKVSLYEHNEHFQKLDTMRYFTHPSTSDHQKEI